jgi:lipopolysaccharide/colanic/teichoic acid biosynthesis glycosyltransferase
MQRALDVFFSLTLIIILLPFLGPLIFVLKFSGEGEVFFRQSRIGRFGKKITILKFATMLKDSPNMVSGTLTIRDDPRVLPLGKFLRKAKINELPQIINIFIGDMSFIGPRPQTQRCFDAFPLHSQKKIIKVRPGLSGIGSVIFRNEEEMITNDKLSDDFYNEKIMPYKGKLEEWYVENESVQLYFYLLFLTVWVVISNDCKVCWKVLKNLPELPEKIKVYF